MKWGSEWVEDEVDKYIYNRKFNLITTKQNNMQITVIAQVAHEINAAYCRSTGDNSQPSWKDAPEWQKTSAIQGVRFHLEHPDAPPSASHESWLQQKAADGWKYGEVKNPDTKEHPCFVPYNELPVEQRSKDYLFKQIVESLKAYV